MPCQDYVFKAIDALPITAHPMTEFATSVMALQVQSEFQKAYEKGIHKSKIYKDGKVIPVNNSLDYGGNFLHMMGFDSPQMQELMRLYVTIHRLPVHFQILTFHLQLALNGLAEPLHGLPNQEVLLWIKTVVEECGENITTEQLKDYVWKTLNSGKAVPGFGHGVLRKTDPRYTCQREFALKHLPDDPLFQLVSMLYEVVPPILTELGKVKNPWPDVDAHSGVLLNYYGLTEARYSIYISSSTRPFQWQLYDLEERRQCSFKLLIYSLYGTELLDCH